MAQIFHKSANSLVRTLIILGVVGVGAIAAGLGLYWRSPYVLGQRVNVVQPVQFTHEHHTAGLGIDCRYCHFSVEQSHFAGIPPTKVCMNCHAQLWTDADILEPVRKSYAEEKPVRWNRVHNLADYVYFNHSVHINKGIGCAECHGRVDRMAGIHQAAPLTMQWCLQCHENPGAHIRPRNEIFNMAYQPPADQEQRVAVAASLVHDYNVKSKISCSTCHR